MKKELKEYLKKQPVFDFYQESKHAIDTMIDGQRWGLYLHPFFNNNVGYISIFWGNGKNGISKIFSENFFSMRTVHLAIG